MNMIKPRVDQVQFSKKIGVLIIFGCGLSFFYLFGIDKIFSWENLVTHFDQVNYIVEHNFFVSQCVYFAAYTLAVAFSLPIASVLTLFGASVFGWAALVPVIGGATCGAFIVFSAAKGISHGFLKRWAGPFFRTVSSGFKDDGFLWLLALRLAPIAPFWVVNIVPAILGMGSLKYILATLIGITPGSLVYIALGNELSRLLSQGYAPSLDVLFDTAIIGPLFALSVLALIPLLLKKTRYKDTNH